MLTDDRDLELLDAARGADLPPSASARAAARAALLHEATQQPARLRRRRTVTFRTKLLVLGFAVLLGVGAPVAIGQLGQKEPSVTAGILCAENVAREPSGSALVSDGRPPTVQCAELSAAGKAPAELTACDSGHGGGVYVYPAGPAVCAKLGLQPVANTVSAVDRRFLAFRQALVHRLGERCMSYDSAQRIVDDEIRRSGMQGWTVRHQGSAQPRPCLSVDVDAASRVVTLAPI